MAQKVTVNITKSKNSVRVSPTLLKVYEGTFVQKFSVLTADSAFIYTDRNAFDAFGHVVITQGDTLHIYADNLNYDDNTKVALLTNNVRMVDKDATLTTNWLNYNTQTKVGTYINGGKIVSKDGKNTLTSQNGYYYANSRDVYFRYNVVSTSPDALINTDTMRYNSGTRITYFYGPTHIYGKKDKDTLYTENGTYNTKSEQAFFGKKNRYSQGTKSLKGDSLFYDKLKGYGKAIKNITFEDTEQRMILKGDLGEYFKGDEKAVVTQNPYVIFVSEDRDTSKKTIAVAPPPVKSAKDSLTSIINTASKLAGNLKLSDTSLIPKNTRTKADSLAKIIAKQPAVKNTKPVQATKIVDSLKKVAGTVANKTPDKKPAISPPTTSKLNPAVAKPTVVASKNKPLASDTKIVYTGPDTGKFIRPISDTAKRMKRDTMYIGADTLETQVVTYKYLKDLQEQRRLAGIRDTSVKLRKPFIPWTLKTLPKNIEQTLPQIVLPQPDFLNRPLPYLPKPVVDSAKIIATQKAIVDKAKKDSLAKKTDVKTDATAKAAAPESAKIKMSRADSLKAGIKLPLSDTSRIRILSAHHNVKIFKSDLQGKSDSLFYSSADSVIRSYVNPMYWTQGAQLSGDTVLLQLKNKKADNMDVFPKAIVVYIEKKDSTHFNQMAGKRLHLWFKDSKISRALVTGNAETVYFNRSEKTEEVKQMQRSLSSTITINFKNGQMANMTFGIKAENKVTPIKDVKEDDKTLKNFTWKPKDRPASKEDVIHPKKKTVETKTKPGAKTPAAKPGTKDATGKGKAPASKTQKPAAKDSTGTSPAYKAAQQALRDSMAKATKQTITIPQPRDKDSLLTPLRPGTTRQIMPINRTLPPDTGKKDTSAKKPN